MTRILILQPFGIRRGGSDNILLTTLRHMDRERIEPVVAFLGPGDFVDDVAELGVRTIVLPPGRLRDPRYVVATARRMRRILEAERPGLLMNWLSTAHVYGGIGAWLAGMSDRCIWWQLDLFAERAPDRARLADRLSTARGQVLDRFATAIPASAIGCCSRSVQTAQDRIPPRRRTLTVIPGIDEPKRIEPDERIAMRHEFGFPDEAVVVGIVGRLFAWKGHHLLVKALHELMAEREEVRGLFVGGGGHRRDEGYERHLQSLVDDLGIRDRVSFTGQVPDATPYLQAMDVFVNASSPEPFGLVLLEAMALEVPCVAVDAGGPAEIIVDGDSGILAPSNDPVHLARAVGRLARDPQLRGRIAAAGLQRFEERFTGVRMAAEMESVLAGLAAS